MDKDLISLIRNYRLAVTTAEKEESISSVIKHLYPKLYLYFLARVSDHDAKDLASETVIDIHKGLKSFKLDTNEAAWGWCYAIAKRKLAQFFEDKDTTITETMDPEILSQLANAAPDHSSHREKDRREEFLDLIQKLRESDPECFMILWDLFILGFTYEELAQKNGKKYDAVRMQTKRCAEKLA